MPDQPAEPPSNALNRVSYLGVADEYIPELECTIRKGETLGNLKTFRKELHVPCVLTGKLFAKGIDEDVPFMLKQHDFINHWQKRGAKHSCTVHKLIFPERPEMNCYAFAHDIQWHPCKV